MYIRYWTAPFWFHAVKRLETSWQGFIRTGFGFANGIPYAVKYHHICQTHLLLENRKCDAMIEKRKS